jgi:uncharacterized protein YecT (DUF1311 family)
MGDAEAAGNVKTAADVCAKSASESALLACRKGENDRSRADMESAIGKLHKRYEDDEPERLKLLTTSQSSWVEFRDAECRFKTFESRNGKAAQVYLLSCQTDLNRLRTKDLRVIVDNP